jgi:hypothetical protein
MPVKKASFKTVPFEKLDNKFKERRRNLYVCPVLK